MCISYRILSTLRRRMDRFKLLLLIWWTVGLCHSFEHYRPPRPIRPFVPPTSNTAFLYHVPQPPPQEQNRLHMIPTTSVTTQSWFVRETLSSILLSLLLWSGTITTIVMMKPDLCHAAAIVETIGKDPNCHDASCLGIWDGLLANCDHHHPRNPISATVAGCVSSQDDTPGTFAEPWDYSDDPTLDTIMTHNSDDNNSNDESVVSPIMERIVNAIQRISNQRGDTVEIVYRQQRYLHVLFTDRNSDEVSDGEFYITPNDTTIQFRLSTTQQSHGTNTVENEERHSHSSRPFILFQPSFKNIDRAELIRKELQWLKLPILRNRQRALFFVESNFDTFGPQSAALGPPEEMKLNDMER